MSDPNNGLRATDETEVVKVAAPLWNAVRTAYHFVLHNAHTRPFYRSFESKLDFLQFYVEAFHASLLADQPDNGGQYTDSEIESAHIAVWNEVKEILSKHYYYYCLRDARIDFNELFPRYQDMVADSFVNTYSATERLMLGAFEESSNAAVDEFESFKNVPISSFDEFADAVEALEKKSRTLVENNRTVRSILTEISDHIKTELHRVREQRDAKTQNRLALIAVSLSAFGLILSVLFDWWTLSHPSAATPIEVSVSLDGEELKEQLAEPN